MCSAAERRSAPSTPGVWWCRCALALKVRTKECLCCALSGRRVARPRDPGRCPGLQSCCPVGAQTSITLSVTTPTLSAGDQTSSRDRPHRNIPFSCLSFLSLLLLRAMRNRRRLGKSGRTTHAITPFATISAKDRITRSAASLMTGMSPLLAARWRVSSALRQMSAPAHNATALRAGVDVGAQPAPTRQRGGKAARTGGQACSGQRARGWRRALSVLHRVYRASHADVWPSVSGWWLHGRCLRPSVMRARCAMEQRHKRERS
jgi:hypothetical protein